MKFIPCPKAYFDKQPKKTRGEVLFLFLEEIGKRNEISSRVLKNNAQSHTREDENEKKGRAHEKARLTRVRRQEPL